MPRLRFWSESGKDEGATETGGVGAPLRTRERSSPSPTQSVSQAPSGVNGGRVSQRSPEFRLPSPLLCQSDSEGETTFGRPVWGRGRNVDVGLKDRGHLHRCVTSTLKDLVLIQPRPYPGKDTESKGKRPHPPPREVGRVDPRPPLRYDWCCRSLSPPDLLDPGVGLHRTRFRTPPYPDFPWGQS